MEGCHDQKVGALAMQVAGLLICQADDASDRLETLLQKALLRARQSEVPSEIRDIL